ncbi:MAG: TlpA family protein disulfide reductase [Chloroflexi bacterium]|nr:TlpA family protein disulfide reductase [Chloroflexota bacterium]
MKTSPSHPALWLLILGGLLIGAAAGLLLFFGLPGATGGASAPAAGDARPEAGAPAPDFALQRLDGRQVRLSDYRGNPLLINFWATWCGPCRVEMPAIQSRYQQYAVSHGFKVLAVDFDEPAPDVAAFTQNLGLTFDVLLDPGARVQDLYRVRAYPTSFFVDRAGVIRAVQIGLMNEAQLDDYLRQIGVP